MKHGLGAVSHQLFCGPSCRVPVSAGRTIHRCRMGRDLCLSYRPPAEDSEQASSLECRCGRCNNSECWPRSFEQLSCEPRVEICLLAGTLASRRYRIGRYIFSLPRPTQNPPNQPSISMSGPADDQGFNAGQGASSSACSPMEGIDGYNTVIKLICCTSIQETIQCRPQARDRQQYFSQTSCNCLDFFAAKCHNSCEQP